MSEMLFGVTDCGGTKNWVAVCDAEMRIIGSDYSQTNPNDYEGSAQGIADNMLRLAAGKGELVAASIAVAAEIDENGCLRRAGGLTPWVGQYLGADVATALGLDRELVGCMGDMEAAALSQYYVNEFNCQPADGVALTLSSGWGAAKYRRDGTTEFDEPGHHHLREGGTCTCGEEGHAEAFLSGNGAVINHGKKMEELLRDPRQADIFVDDLSVAVHSLVERYSANGFHAEELRWMGGVAAGQPLLMRRAAERVQRQLGHRMPAWDAVSMGAQAGLHGSFLDAQNRAKAA